MSILVVDDSEENRDLMQCFLHDAGYDDVQMADSAEEAYGVLGLLPGGVEAATFSPHRDLTGSPIELIFMDIGMPVTDGIEACRRIKKHDRLREVPLIFVTARTDAGSVRAAFAAGAADLVSKPVVRANLLARMRAVLERSPH